MAVDISESFSTSRVDERSSSYFIDEHMKTQPLLFLFDPVVFLRCWKNVATTPSSRLRDFQTITFPYMIAFYFLFIYFLFFYRGILLAEHIINWWVNQIVRMHALTPVYNYRN